MKLLKFLSPADYQPKIAERFDELRAQILTELPNARIEHIGASALPGAWSKGDLDVFVGVPAAEMDASIGAIEKLGFRVKEDTLRTPELCMLERAEGDTDVAVQLVVNGSRFEFFITFRDALIESPELLARYNELKRSCSGTDPETYREKKSAFIEAVLAGNQPDH